MWTVRHRGWCLDTDQAWLRMFAQTEDLKDVGDANEESVNHFLIVVGEKYSGDWAVHDARMAVVRFMRFYEARTRSFTKSPRRVRGAYPQENS
jgi:hypothetical protein